jgi:glycosyltransferase involved in cell wall biosynthesis
MIVCEPSIGYPDGGFAKFRVFESYAVMHAYLGMEMVRSSGNDFWYDVVIPSYFDVNDFEFSAAKDDYFLFLGRVYAGKGVHIAVQVVEAIGAKLVVAGPGALESNITRTDRPLSEYVDVVGVVGPKDRKRLMARAKATFTASTFVEPFCFVQVESMLSGTPVISTDWGAFAEYNLHGVTGYRCRTFEQFVWAARNIQTIDPYSCRFWAERNFSLERIGDLYEEYFFSVRNIYGGDGWYAANPARRDLDWLRRYAPDGNRLIPAG